MDPHPRRTSDPDPVRLLAAQSCDPTCRLCRGTETAQDGAILERMEHVKRSACAHVYLMGQRLCSSPSFRATLAEAKKLGLRVSLIECDATLSATTVKQALRGVSFHRFFLSLPEISAPVSEEVRLPAEWRKSFESLRSLLQEPRLAVGSHVRLAHGVLSTLGLALRLQARLGVPEILLSDISPPAPASSVKDSWMISALNQVWEATHQLGIQLVLLGFERTVTTLSSWAPGEPPTYDSSLSEIVRRRIPLAAWRSGLRALGPEGIAPQLPVETQALRTLGLEMASLGAPFVDLPACLGGVLRGSGPEIGRDDFRRRKVDACGPCRVTTRCSGAPEMLLSRSPALADTLSPLPGWYELPAFPRIVVLCSRGGDPLDYASTFPGLAHALRRQGAQVEIVSPWLSLWRDDELPNLQDAAAAGPDIDTTQVETWLREHGLAQADLVIASDLPSAGAALAQASLGRQTPVLVPDFHMLEHMDYALQTWVRPGARAAEGGWWPSPRLILQSGFPGYAHLYDNYGIPREQILWRPYALCPSHFPSGPDPTQGRHIFSGGEHLRDLLTLRQACETLRRPVHPIDLYAPGDSFTAGDLLAHRGIVSVANFCRSLATSRFVLLPLQEDPTRAAGITVLAMALFAGRPLVATSTAATRDYLQHDIDALLVPPNDPLALAQAITRLDTEPGLLARLAAGARETATRMSTDAWARDLLSGQPSGPRWTTTGWRPW